MAVGYLQFSLLSLCNLCRTPLQYFHASGYVLFCFVLFLLQLPASPDFCECHISSLTLKILEKVIARSFHLHLKVLLLLEKKIAIDAMKISVFTATLIFVLKEFQLQDLGSLMKTKHKL